jgi:hypothetical protein
VEDTSINSITLSIRPQPVASTLPPSLRVEDGVFTSSCTLDVSLGAVHALLPASATSNRGVDSSNSRGDFGLAQVVSRAPDADVMTLDAVTGSAVNMVRFLRCVGDPLTLGTTTVDGEAQAPSTTTTTTGRSGDVEQWSRQSDWEWLQGVVPPGAQPVVWNSRGLSPSMPFTQVATGACSLLLVLSRSVACCATPCRSMWCHVAFSPPSLVRMYLPLRYSRWSSPS